MKKITTILCIAILTGISLTGCGEDYLNVAPTNKVPSNTVSGTLNGLYNAINGIHRKMVSQDLSNQGLGGEPGFIIAREAEGDDMTWVTISWHKNYLNWSVNSNASTQYNYGIWETYYKFILNANMVLEALEANFPVAELTEKDKAYAEYIEGEALAIRAWAHFHLVQMYAKRYDAGKSNTQPGVMYRKSSVIEPMARHSVEDVYKYINEDLEKASTLLKGYSAYLKNSGVNTVNHYTEKVTLGLQARVALAQQNYGKAAEYAVKAIDVAEQEGNKIMTRSQLSCGFANITTDTSDALYAATTLNDQTVYFYSFYAYMSWNFNSSSIRSAVKCISQSTYDMMAAGDLRREWWDPSGTASVPSKDYVKKPYQNRKFRARASSDPVGDFPFMRLSELYLTAAEAYARENKDTDAQRYLNALMVERINPNTYAPTTNTGNALIDEIMLSRRVELWGEGFRWFDLKRLDLPLKRTGSNFDSSYCGFLEKGNESSGEDGWKFILPEDETQTNNLAEND